MNYEHFEEQYDEFPTVEKIRRKPKKRKDKEKEHSWNKVDFAIDMNSEF